MTKEQRIACYKPLSHLLHRDLDSKQVLYREMVLDRAKIDEEKRTVEASLSSEIEIPRGFGREKLLHTPAAVNLERAEGGLPLLFAHNQDQPIGLVENVRLDGARLRGTLRFSKNVRASEVWEDVREGFLKNISIGYRIEKWEESDDDDLITASRWTVFEASVLSVPADNSVGIGRAVDPAIAAVALAAAGAGAAGLSTRDEDEGTVNVVEFQQARDDAMRAGKAEAQKEFRERTGKIHTLFAPFLNRGPTFQQLRDELVVRGTGYEQARDALFKLFEGNPQPLASDLEQAAGSANGLDEQVRTLETPQGRRREQITGGQDSVEKFREGVTDALLVRVDSMRDDKKKAEASSNEFLSMGPVELAREYLKRINQGTRGLSRDRLIGLALTTRGLISHSTSDFANILEDVSNKSLQIGYNETPETWNLWCRTGTIPDFRPANRPNMSAFGDLDVIYEDGEYKYGSYSDLKETLQLSTYGKLFSISRQALVNDDLSALGRIPQGMGRAAARKVGDLAYNVLINGITATLNQDATALFHANHSNFVDNGSGAVPSVATINAARTSMATQTDPSGNAILNIKMAFLLVPYALEGTGKAIQMAEKDPAIASGEMPNTVRGTFETIAEGRLDAADSAAWYMAASPGQVETVEVAFLDGQQTPYMETQNGWSTDGVSYKVRHDATAAPLDFRGLYKNDGN